MENNVGNGESGRRRFIRRLTTLGAAGGIATLLYGRVTEKPLIQLAQAASGDPFLLDTTNTGTGETTLTAFTNGAMTLSVENQSSQDMSKAILGDASGLTGLTTGVFGETSSTEGKGVQGYAGQATGNTFGVYGGSNSAAIGTGVYGEATASTGTAYGVYGRSFSSGGISVYGEAGNRGAKPIVARGASSQNANLQEWQNSAGTVLAVVDAVGQLGAGTTAPLASVHGQTAAIGGIGVYGLVANYSGTNAGVRGETYSIAGGAAVVGYAGSYDGSAIGVHGISHNASGVGVMGEATQGSTKPIIAKGAPDQAASLQEWQNSSGSALGVVDASGQFGVGTSAPVAPLHLYYNTPTMLKAEADGSTPCILSLDTYATGSTTSGAGFVGRHSRGTKASPTDVVVGDRLGFNIFGGYAGGAFRHVAGIEGVVDTGTVSTTSLPSAIRFLTTPDGSMSRQERMRIDANGNMIPPTDNSGSIGTASKRWSNLYVVTLHQGDIVFENGYRVTEDTQSGLRFLNEDGQQIAKLDHEGNWHIKGDIIKDL